MKFSYFILNEDAPMGGMPPMGGPPAGGMGAPPPPMGGMGGPPGGGMGGPPGMDPMGGGMGGAPTAPPQNTPTLIPKHADVWEVLDALLNQKPMPHEEKIKKQDQQPDVSMQGAPPPLPGGVAPPPPMGGPPMGQPSLMQ